MEDRVSTGQWRRGILVETVVYLRAICRLTGVENRHLVHTLGAVVA